MKIFNSYSFLTIGKTKESTEASEGGKKYVGLASSYVLAVNPNKAELEKIYGREQANDPEYVSEGENGKEVHVHFIVRTDPAVNNEIEITSRLMFTLRNTPAYNKDETKVEVIDSYGNTTWADVNDAREGKPLYNNDGTPKKIDTKYRMACVGESNLVGFLKKYLCVEDAFEYVNGVWTKKANAADCTFMLEHIKDYFNGNFSELREALKLQPNNKVKLLWGVRTTEDNKQYQTVASREDLILPNYAGSIAAGKVAARLQDAKDRGAYATTEFKVQELQEFKVESTDFTSTSDSASEMPWD